MKNKFKMSGIIFILIALCFTLTVCDEDESLGSQVKVSGSTLAQKIEWVKSHRSSGTTYTIEVTANEEISGYEITSGSNKNMTIILNGNGKTISLKNDAAKWLFMIGNDVKLELNNITLKGHDHNKASLVMVIGELVVNDGTKIISNKVVGKVTDIIGNNVVIKDGEIGYGGGVWVYSYGIFTMNGGEISGNSAGYGGGVFVEGYGIFRITNGTIYGSNAVDDLKNTSVAGAALSIRSVGSAQYGTFNGDTWINKGSLSGTDNTIRVINGVLQ